MLSVIFALLLCGSAYSTTVWPQGCYNSQRSSFAMPHITPQTLECQPTLTSTFPLALSSSGHPDLNVDPVVGNHSVLYYVNEANALTALDVNTNTVLWTIKSNSSFSAPVLSQDGDLLYTLRDKINFTVYSVETQDVVWYYDRIPSGKFENYLKNIVVAPNGVVYLNMLEFQASNMTILYAFDISKPVNTELWNRTDINFFIIPSVSEDGKLYVSDTENLYSLNPTNGSTIWKLSEQYNDRGVRVRSDGNVLIKSDRYLLLVSPEGKVITNSTDFEDYVVTPENQVIGVQLSHPNRTVIALLNSNFTKFEWNVSLSVVYSSLTIDAIDEEIYVHAVEFESGKANVIKLDMKGNITWTTQLQYTPNKDGYAFSNVIPVGDGSVIIRAGNFLYHLTTCNAGHGTCKTAGGVCECEASYFGDNCSIQCECGANGKCSAQGKCECNEGWKGDKCSDKASEPASNENLIIGLAVGGGVLVIGAVAAFFFVRQRKRAQYESIKH